MPDTSFAFRFSTRGLPDDDALAAYAGRYARGSQVGRGAGPVHASLLETRIGRLLLTEAKVTGIVHERPAGSSPGQMGHFDVGLLIKGQVGAVMGDRTFTLQPDQVAICDLRKATRLDFRGAHLVTATIAADLAELAFGPVDDLHGRVFEPPATTIYADLAVSLARNGAGVGRIAAPHVMRSALSLMAGMAGLPVRASETRKLADLNHREAVEQYIVANITDPTLDADRILRSVGLSRSALYRLLKRHGGVSTLIRRRRAECLRAALKRNPTASTAALLAACGYDSEAELRREYQRHWGAALPA